MLFHVIRYSCGKGANNNDIFHNYVTFYVFHNVLYCIVYCIYFIVYILWDAYFIIVCLIALISLPISLIKKNGAISKLHVQLFRYK